MFVLDLMVKELSEEQRAEVKQKMEEKGMIAQTKTEKSKKRLSSVSQEDLQGLVKQFMSVEQEP